MRRLLIGGLAALMGIMIGLPAALGLLSGRTPAAAQPQSGASAAGDMSDSLKIKVYLPDSSKVVELPLSEYLVGVVAAEMPPEFHDEALKAQFVVARTYAVRRMQQFVGPGKSGCPLNPAADICADPGTGQAYLSKADYAASKGTAEADQVWRHLTDLQAATRGQVLRYKGQFIDPLYHASSGTVTEDSGDYFPQSLPYLKSVDDHWATIAPNLKATERRTPEALSRALASAGKTVAVPALASSVKAGKAPVEILDKTPAGRVKTVKVQGVVMTGRELREALGLPSTNFTVGVESGAVVFRTTGKGHGVGMSQWGANGMAQEGKGYYEILKHYYTGVAISTIFTD